VYVCIYVCMYILFYAEQKTEGAERKGEETRKEGSKRETF
jgi:hypothetical protein